VAAEQLIFPKMKLPINTGEPELLDH
jgi:hypothetical protein